MNETARRIRRSRFAMICAAMGTGVAAIVGAFTGLPFLTFGGSIIGAIIGSVLDRRYPPHEPPERADASVDSQ